MPGAAGGADGAAGVAAASGAFERRHWITIGIIGALLSGVIFFDVDVGLGAFGCAVVLALLKAGDENEAIRLMPWRVMMMVCGVTVLVSVLDRTGGLELFTRVLAGVSTANTVTAFDGRCIPADHAGNRTGTAQGRSWPRMDGLSGRPAGNRKSLKSLNLLLMLSSTLLMLLLTLASESLTFASTLLMLFSILEWAA